MSQDSSNSDWLEKALEATRRNVRQLEIDACRIRTNLARIEVANAAGISTEDVAALVRDVEPVPLQPAAVLNDALAASPELRGDEGRVPLAASDALDWQPAGASVPEGMNILVGAQSQSEPQPEMFDSQPAGDEFLPFADLNNSLRGTHRRATSPVMASIVLHSVILLLTFSVTVATIERQEQPFSATFFDLSEQAPAKLESVNDDRQLRDLGETAAKDLGSDSQQLDGVGALSQDPVPLDLQSIGGPLSLGAVGTFDPLATDPTELGKLAAGEGGLGADAQGVPTGLGKGNQRGRGGGGVAGGRNAGGRLDAALFFGTQAKGDRFVFVVDNSSSMKGGRLEMATAELKKTIDSLSPRQSFYVIFVSDKTYPMFYPQQEPALVTATPANKQRLADWMPKAILASGKNRELIKAMDLAASLNPQAVYLLWDGDLRYSEKVRTEVMMHLTQPNRWNFVVHTLGMGISSLDSEMNLTAIAQAHHGVYRRIDLPPVRTR